MAAQSPCASHMLVYGIDPGAPGRLNAILFTVMFMGMANGAALGTLLLHAWGCAGVTALGCVAALLAMVVRC